MVGVFLSGPGGAGKTTIVEHIFGNNGNKKRKRNPFQGWSKIVEVARGIIQERGLVSRDFTEPRRHLPLQEPILKAQNEAERNLEQDYVSDRCVLDCLAYARWRCDQLEDEEAWKEFREKLKDDIEESVKRYQKGLVVLVHPWRPEGGTKGDEDGVRLTMNAVDCRDLMKCFVRVANEFSIAYLDLTVSDFEARIRILEDAVFFGKIPLPGKGKLDFYKEPKRQNGGSKDSSSSNNNKSSPVSNTSSTHFPFHLKPPASFSSTCVPSLTVTETQLKLAFENTIDNDGQISRFVKKYGCSRLAFLHFDHKTKGQDVQKTLLGKIYIGGELYSFLGCSASGLKSRKCALWRGTATEAAAILEECGQFAALKTVSKRMARVGQLFSKIYPSGIVLNPDEVEMVDDIESADEKYNFTDGCGSIGVNLAKKIYDGMPDKVPQPDDYLPSAFQIRYQGCKGMVAVDSTCDPDKMLVRPSMEKFKTVSFPEVGICGFSSPYSFGHLNRQLIYLLSGLKVPDESFLKLQADMFSCLSSMFSDPEAAIDLLCWHGKFELAAEVAKINRDDFSESIEVKYKNVKTGLNEILSSFRTKGVKIKLSKEEGEGEVEQEKLRILVRKSRTVYGVCDQSDKLEYGQCFLRTTIGGVPTTITGAVISGRMPCYLLGDIRVLEAVDVPDLEHLVDCVVFPTKGERPHADEQAGGDLDGDKFFICWDERLIPPSGMSAPSPDYPAAAAKADTKITLEKMIKYFSIQNKAMSITGLLDGLYRKWADAKGPASPECDRLGQLFGRAIDASKSGETVTIPAYLQKPPVVNSNDTNFVWHQLERKAIAFKAEYLKEALCRRPMSAGRLNVEDVTTEFVKDLLRDDNSPLSEYQKFMFAWLWCWSRHPRLPEQAASRLLADFAPLTNFALFGLHEKLVAVDLGVSLDHVLNGLRKSILMEQDDLEHFGLFQSPNSFGLSYSCMAHEEFDFVSFSNALAKQSESFIILRMPEEVLLVLWFREKLVLGAEEAHLAKESLRSFFISRKFGIRETAPLGCGRSPNDQLFYDLVEDRFQVYRERRVTNTYVWIKRNSLNFKHKGNMVEILPKFEVEDSLSVDLTTFPGNLLRRGRTGEGHPTVNKAPILAVEVFGIKDGQPAYPDVLVGNQVELPEQIVADDFIGDEDEPADVGLDEKEADDAIGRLLADPLQQYENDELCPATLIVALEGMVAEFCPVVEGSVVPKVLKGRLGMMVQAMSSQEVGLRDKLRMMVLLNRLHQCDLVSLLDPGDLSYSSDILSELLELLLDWQMSFYLGPEVLTRLLQSVNGSAQTKEGVSKDHVYVLEMVWMAMVEYLNDLTLAKEVLGTEGLKRIKLDKHSDDETNTESKQDEKVLNFYSMSFANSPSARPSIGDHLAIFRTKDVMTRDLMPDCNGDKGRFPKTLSAVTLGVVVSVFDAPLNIGVEIIDSKIPNCMVNSPEGVSWTLATLGNANVTLITRIIRSSLRLLETPQHEDLFNSIYQLDDADHCNGLSALEGSFNGEVANGMDFTSDCHQESVLSQLNPAQTDAAKSALVSPLTVIQGPPGTGKTKVACSILYLASRQNRPEDNKCGNGVLAVAETNTAVNNMTKRLLDMGVNVVRVGNRRFVPEDLLHVTLDGKLSTLAEKEGRAVSFRGRGGRQAKKKNIVKKVLREADVILATCAGAADPDLSELNFDFVLLDEATQTKEPTLLCALAAGANKLVMIGDPMQLGPCVSIEKDWNWLLEEDAETVQTSLEATLFHRMYQRSKNNLFEIKFHFLDTQYRMHPGISSFPGRHFYDGQLKDGVTAEQRPVPWINNNSSNNGNNNNPTLLVDVADGCESRKGSSYCNRKEAEVVLKIVQDLLANGCHREDLAVLTLYSGQVRLLRETLAKIRVEVSSIDCFQGREAEVVVVSTVRADGRLGFSDDPNRLNVLLTRARRGLVVVTHLDTFVNGDGASGIWAGWAKGATKVAELQFEQPKKEPKKEVKGRNKRNNDRRRKK